MGDGPGSSITLISRRDLLRIAASGALSWPLGTRLAALEATTPETLYNGIRLGSPAMTTRGFGTAEAVTVGHLIADVLDAPQDEARIASVRARVAELTARFPVYR